VTTFGAATIQPDAGADQLDQLIEAIMDEHSLPGVGAAIWVSGPLQSREVFVSLLEQLHAKALRLARKNP
jgi:hypothetical protein